LPKAGKTKSRGRKKVKKNVPNGIANIKATFNNTIINITDPEGNTIAWSSAGAGSRAPARALRTRPSRPPRRSPSRRRSTGCARWKSA